LPQELANALSIDNERAVKVVYRILNDNKKDLDTIMKDEDLPEYPWFEKPASSLQTVSFPALDDTEPYSSSMPTPASPTDASSDHDDHDHDVVVTRVDQRSTAPYSRVESSIPSPVHDHTIWEEVAWDQQYKSLLREVIRQARRGWRSHQRRGGSLSLDGIDEALDELAQPPADYAAFYRTFGDTGRGRFEGNARVGAAGELYVSLWKYSILTHERELTWTELGI
jgi:hypothetical protein